MIIQNGLRMLHNWNSMQKMWQALYYSCRFDVKVQKEYIHVLRENGTVLNTQILIASAKGIIHYYYTTCT